MRKLKLFCCLLSLTALRVSGETGSPQSETSHTLSTLKAGLAVTVGYKNAAELVKLRANGARLVHGLATGKNRIEKDRSYLADRNLYGPITVGKWDGGDLPYVDNLVNVVIVGAEASTVKRSEIMRVLAPGGAAFFKDQSNRLNPKKTITKTVPPDIDSWPHYLYDASNNAVSRDTRVAPPRGMHWVCGPPYARSHEHFASVSAMVSAGGRIFYIEDVGPINCVFLPPEWQLVARDAFSGVLLWKRPIKNWESHLRGFRSGPPEIGWRLVADSERVYVALSYGDPVRVLDAATGKEKHVLKATEGARELRYKAGVLYILADDMTASDHKRRKEWFIDKAASVSQYTFPKKPLPMYGEQRIMAFDVNAGRMLWQNEYQEPGKIMPATLAIDKGHVCFQTVSHVVCLDAKSGKRKWRSERPVAKSRFSWSTPTLVMSDGVVVIGDRMPEDNIGKEPEEGSEWIMDNHHQIPHQKGEVTAFSLKDGRMLWRAPAFENYTIPMDIFVIDEVVWTGDIRSRNYPGFTKGRDLHTGKIVSEIPDNKKLYNLRMGHNRCYRNKATERYLVLGRDGIEFLDLKNGTGYSGWWARGTCQYGVMPANGLVYVPKHSCACHIQEKLNGFNVLSANSSLGNTAGGLGPSPQALERGPAYSSIEKLNPENEDSAGWPVYRKDARRSGFQNLPAPQEMKVAWTEKFAPPLTAPVFASGKVFVAETDRQALHAVSESGGKAWTFFAGGRIDSPPAVCKGLCVFGTRNGYVYCLRAEDGEPAWRFRAAPRRRLLFAYEQLESAWPVHGSVLIDDKSPGESPVVYFAAGRSSHLDGGIQLYALDLYTGKVLHHRRIATMRGESGEDVIEKRALPGIMSLEKDRLFMRHLCFDKGLSRRNTAPHLYAPGGFLDKTWWHRTYWIYGTRMASGWGGWPRVGNRVPAGRLLVFDGGGLIYGYGRMRYRAGRGHVHPDPTKDYKLFAEVQSPGNKKKKRKIQWTRKLPFVVRAMVLTPESLLVAGGKSSTESAAEHGPGKFMIASRKDGSKRFECELPAPPGLDGMIFTGQGVFISAIDGSLICMDE